MRVSLLVIVGMAVTASVQVVAQGHDLAIELVEVTARAGDAGTERVLSDAAVTRPTHDAGELLRSVTGMTALRRGGRGFDPIIRGQSESNLNVISNGAFNYGACPARMDPPSTYVNVDSFDSVSVIKGHRSVIYGSGGSGGTLLFEHERPDFADGWLTGRIDTGYTSNSSLRSTGADVAAGGDAGYLRVFGADKRSGNYRDGDGERVASSFNSQSLGAVAGFELYENGWLELSHDRAEERDIWYAGNGMDSPYADSESTTVNWEQKKLGVLDALQLTLYRSEVSHLMNNYQVRDRMPMVANGSAVPSSSDTWGGRLLLTLAPAHSQVRLGVDSRANDRSATLYMDVGKDGSYDVLVARMWPDVRIRQWGAFAEVDYQLTDRDQLRAGLRLDHHTSRAVDASRSAGALGAATPALLYQRFYGSDAEEQRDLAVSAVLGWDRQLESDTLFSANLSRSVRAPDATERWFARSAMGSFWVGNPSLRPEVHQQLDLTVMHNFKVMSVSASAFANRVDDFIDRYQSAAASLYRNTDATLYGVEIDGEVTVSNALSASLGVAWTRGESDEGHLARIAPLEARLNLNYAHQNWGLGAEWIVAARQNRINPPVDVAESTPGFGVVHLYGHVNIADSLTLEAGIENLLDKAYAYHVNAGSLDPFSPQAVRVNEPGRQGWVKVRYRF